jgi:hypothetical protein
MHSKDGIEILERTSRESALVTKVKTGDKDANRDVIAKK